MWLPGLQDKVILLQGLRILHPLRASCCLLAVLGLNTLNKNLRGEFIYREDVTNAVWKEKNNWLCMKSKIALKYPL